MALADLIQKAKKSSFSLWLLNRQMRKFMPFNKPHGFKIKHISDCSLTVQLPYQESNLNHVKGLHACSLATLAEYVTGFLLLSRLDPQKYRVLMQSINIVYHYQGKMDAVATYAIDDQWLTQHILMPLQTAESIMISAEVNIYDLQKNHLCTGTIGWQIKRWDKVKTKV